MHFVRGGMGAIGNACFFWTLTHMLLADAMALEFSRPLFMIPLAVLFLGEMVGWRRAGVTLAGFLGILIYARPFTAGFDPGVFIGALGALAGGLVVICIKRLQTTEPTRVISAGLGFRNIHQRIEHSCQSLGLFQAIRKRLATRSVVAVKRFLGHDSYSRDRRA